MEHRFCFGNNSNKEPLIIMFALYLTVTSTPVPPLSRIANSGLAGFSNTMAAEVGAAHMGCVGRACVGWWWRWRWQQRWRWWCVTGITKTTPGPEGFRKELARTRNEPANHSVRNKIPSPGREHMERRQGLCFLVSYQQAKVRLSPT